MAGKFLILLSALACLSHVSSHALTKEIRQGELQTPHQEFRNAIQALETVDVRKDIVELVLRTPQQAIFNVVDLLTKSNHPTVPEVLGAFNDGLGSKMFIINEEFVQIDANAFERMLSDNLEQLVKKVYPKDYFKQLIVMAMIQQKINQVAREIRPLIDANKIPVDAFEEVLSRSDNTTAIRASALKETDVLGDLLGTIEKSICNSLASVAANTVNNTLTTYITFLKTISISSSDNVWTNLVATGINFVVDLAEGILEDAITLTKSLSNSICDTVLHSGIRNSVSSSRRNVAEVQPDTAVADTLEQALATRGLLDGLWDLLWSLISDVIGELLRNWVADFIADVKEIADSFLDGINGYLDDLIDNIFGH